MSKFKNTLSAVARLENLRPCSNHCIVPREYKGTERDIPTPRFVICHGH